MTKRFKQLFLLISLILFSFLISFIVYRVFVGQEMNALREKFNFRAENFLFAIHERYIRNQTVLDGAKGLIAASDYLSKDEWRRFVEALELKTYLPGIKWVAVARVLSEQDMSTFISMFHEKEDPNFAMWPKEESGMNAPIIYIEPSTYREWLGFNLSTDKNIESAFAESLKTRKIVAADAIHFSPVDNVKSEFLFLDPAYKQTDRELTHFGWIVAKIDFKILIEKVAEGTQLSGINIEAFKGTSSDLANRFFDRSFSADTNPLFSLEKTIHLGNDDWTFHFHADPSYKQELEHTTPALVFLLLLAVTLTGSFFMYYGFKLKQGALGFDCAQVLSSIPFAMITTDTSGVIQYASPLTDRLLSYKPEELEKNLSFEKFFDPPELEGISKEFSALLKRDIPANIEVFKAMAENETPREKECTFIKKDQSKIKVRLFVAKMHNTSGSFVGYLATLTPV